MDCADHVKPSRVFYILSFLRNLVCTKITLSIHNDYNMQKKVFCLIEGRCKCIKFISEENVSDVDIIVRKLKEASKTDSVLNTMLQQKMLVLQKSDPDRNNKLCDLENDDEIVDKSEVTVLLIPECINTTTESDSFSSVHKDNEPFVKVLYTEPIDNSAIDIQSATSACYLNMKEDEKEKEVEQLLYDGPSSSKQSKIEENLQSMKPQVTGPGSIRCPAILPPITPDLKKKLDDIGLLKAQKNFIAFWASYLSYETNQWPTKLDYQNFAQSIVAAYPALADTGGGCTVVKSQLSIWIRNHRALEKRQLQKRKNDTREKLAFVRPIDENINRTTDHVTNTDIQSALKELEKKFIDNKNISHMKHLLKMTITHRRPWIDEAKRIVDIVQKYPQLNNYELILSEFLELKKITKEALFNEIGKMIEKLRKYYSVQKSTEHNMASIMQNLCADLTKKKNKNISALFTIKEIMGNIDNLITNEGDAPRIVMYTDNENIMIAYLVADAEIKIQIPQPTIENIIAGLFASYYVWNRKFPTAYVNILNFMNYELLKSPLPTTCTTVKRFIRSRDNILKDLNTIDNS